MQTEHQLNLARLARQKGCTGKDRGDAIAKGLPFYDGAPCKECNETVPAVRYTRDRKCTYCAMSMALSARYATGAQAEARKARRRAYRAAEYARRKEKRAQLAHAPDGAMTSPMAQLLGTILSTGG